MTWFVKKRLRSMRFPLLHRVLALKSFTSFSKNFTRWSPMSKVASLMLATRTFMKFYPLQFHENGAPSYMCDWVLVFYTQMTRKKLTWGFPFSCMVSGSTSRPLLIWFPKQLMCNLKLLMSQKGVIENNITDSF